MPGTQYRHNPSILRHRKNLVADCVKWLAREGLDKKEIKEYLIATTGASSSSIYKWMRGHGPQRLTHVEKLIELRNELKAIHAPQRLDQCVHRGGDGKKIIWGTIPKKKAEKDREEKEKAKRDWPAPGTAVKVKGTDTWIADVAAQAAERDRKELVEQVMEFNSKAAKVDREWMFAVLGFGVALGGGIVFRLVGWL